MTTALELGLVFSELIEDVNLEAANRHQNATAQEVRDRYFDAAYAAEFSRTDLASPKSRLDVGNKLVAFGRRIREYGLETVLEGLCGKTKPEQAAIALTKGACIEDRRKALATVSSMLKIVSGSLGHDQCAIARLCAKVPEIIWDRSKSGSEKRANPEAQNDDSKSEHTNAADQSKSPPLPSDAKQKIGDSTAQGLNSASATSSTTSSTDIAFSKATDAETWGYYFYGVKNKKNKRVFLAAKKRGDIRTHKLGKLFQVAIDQLPASHPEKMK